MAVAKIWNGTQWVTPFFKYPQIWDGTQWCYARPRVFNGATWGGASSQTLTVTVGGSVVSQQYVGTTYTYGFSSSNSLGSINPTRATVVDGSPVITELYWSQFSSINGTVSYTVYFKVVGEGGDTLTADDIGDWTTMNIAGVNYLKSSATISASGGKITFSWTADATNPFGTTNGASKTVTFS